MLARLPSVTIMVNSFKPRKGCFEVKAGDKAILSLLAMPRPFKALREADLGAVAAEVVAALGSSGSAAIAALPATAPPAGPAAKKVRK